MAQSSLGLNMTLPIYNQDGTLFHNLELKKFTVDSIVMSLGDKITGDVYYESNDLEVTMREYVTYNGVKYVLVNPPTIVKEGMVSNNSDLKGMTKYSFEFYHPMYMLGNFPFTDVAVSNYEKRYLSESKNFSWIGLPSDYIDKLNKNLENTEWVVVMSERFPVDKQSTMSGVLQFSDNTIAEALKIGYETWGVPYVVDIVKEDSALYANGKRFLVQYGLPVEEILDNNGLPFVFKCGKGVGLKNNSRTPRNNKIVTRISGYGSENNIPYGYPQIVWDGSVDDPRLRYTLYDGIVGGQNVKLINHPFTRKTLMPSIYSERVNKKVNPNAEGYDPNIELIDYYDATDEYPNKINPLAPSYISHEFDVKPEMDDGESNVEILDAWPLNDDLTIAESWNDMIDADGNYLQSYFKMKLPILSFDLYSCAAITEEMQINMRSGACLGCTFAVQVDWEDYKLNFYDSEGNFAPNGSQRNTTKYPKSNALPIEVVLKKENATFGTLMPNQYQYPQEGDEFVVLGISLPLEYIKNAERRLDDEMKAYMLENNVYYFDYPLKFSEHFLATHTNILSQLKPNVIVRFEFADQEMQLFVKQLTIKYGSDVLPQYDITLTDNVDVVLNQIGQVVSDVEHLSSLISLLRAFYNKGIFGEMSTKLSRISDDTAQGIIGFLRGVWFGTKKWFIDNDGNANLNDTTVNGLLKAYNATINKVKSSNYNGDGMLDTGWQIINDFEGTDSYAVFDRLYIRKKATFEELEVRKWSGIGGNFICSPSAGVIWMIDYFDAEGNELGYEYKKVPWTLFGRLMILFTPHNANNRYLGRVKKIKRPLTNAEKNQVRVIRCYTYNDDGTTQTMTSVLGDRIIGAQMRCQTINKAALDYDGSVWTGKHISNHYWWRLVQGYGSKQMSDGRVHDYVDFWVNLGSAEATAANEDTGSDWPEEGDVFVQMGHRTETALSNIISLETSTADAPAIKEYRGVNSWDLNGKQKTKISPTTGNEFYATKFHIETQYEDVLIPADHGAWSSGMACAYYDRVSHNGSLWLCIAPNGTTIEPGDATQEQRSVWQKQVSKGDQGEASFKSTVFKRSASKPSKPTGGSYSSPVPSGWSDGLPSGTDSIWMTTRVFSTDGNYPQESAWTDVQLMSDTESFDVEFAKKQTNDATPALPNGHNQHGGDQTQVWFDPSLDTTTDFTTMIWMAERTKNNGVWGAWKITKIKGEDGGFKSRVFKRTNTTPSTPSGGTYDNPIPSGWNDGIPSGAEILWSSVCTFWVDGTSSGWSTPAQETDTSVMDIEYSPSSTKPNKPTGNPFANRESQGWYDPTSANFPSAGTMIWRAERKVKNGAWESGGDWVITRIYGEKGDPGVDATTTALKYTGPLATGATAPTVATYKNFTWTDNIPNQTEAQPNVYVGVWEYTAGTTLNINTTSPKSVSLFAHYGKTGSDGKDGKDGKDGTNGTSVSITTKSVTYQASSSGTTTPTGAWSTTVPSVDQGKFLWTKTYVKYSDNTETVSYGVSYRGIDGTNPIFADISEEMDSAACSSDGKTLSQYTRKVFVSMWVGSIKQTLTNITVSGAPSGATVTKNTTEGSVTFSIPANTSLADTTRISITLSANGLDNQTLYFTLNGVRCGKDGAIYKLAPFDTEIIRKKDGTISPLHNIFCDVNKVVGGSYITAPQSEYKLKVKIDGGTEQNYNGATGYAPSSINTSLEFILYDPTGATVYDRETIPAVEDGDNMTITSQSVTYQVSTSGTTVPTGTWSGTIPTVPQGQFLWTKTYVLYADGTSTTSYSVSYNAVNGIDGTSPYFADIDNEMDSIACDSSGKTTAAYDVTVNVNMWHGSTPQALTKLTTTSVSGVTITANKTNKTIRFQVSSGTTIAKVNNVTITIASSGSGDKTLHFTLNGVRAGADGSPATIYSLVPSVSSVVKKKDGTYSVNNVSCTRQKNVGGTITNNTTDGTITYKLDGGTEQSYTNNTNIAVTNFTKSIQFIFKVNSVVVDTESIPMVADGTNGTNGKDGSNGTDGKNGASIVPVPNALVINQEKTTTGAKPLSNISEYIFPVARDGASILPITTLTITESKYCDSTVENDATYGKHIKITGIWKLQTNDDGSYKTSGGNYIKYTGSSESKVNDKWVWKYAASGSVTFTALATTSGGQTLSATISVPFACNLLGTYFVDIEDDMKTEVAQKVTAEITADGVLTTTNFDNKYNNASWGVKQDITKTINELKGNGSYDRTTGFTNSRLSTAEQNISSLSTSLGNTYTKTETATYVSQQISTNNESYYTKSETSSLVNTRISDNNNNYYTKTETSNLVSTEVKAGVKEVASNSLSSPSVWEQGSTDNEDTGSSYDEIKIDASTRIRTIALWPITNNVRVKYNSNFTLGVIFFTANKLVASIGWQGWFSGGDSTLSVPDDAHYMAVLLGRNTGVSPSDAATANVKIICEAVATKGYVTTTANSAAIGVKTEIEGELRDTGIDIDDGTIALYGDQINFYKTKTGGTSSSNLANIRFNNTDSIYEFVGLLRATDGAEIVGDDITLSCSDELTLYGDEASLESGAYLELKGNSGITFTGSETHYSSATFSSGVTFNSTTTFDGKTTFQDVVCFKNDSIIFGDGRKYLPSNPSTGQIVFAKGTSGNMFVNGNGKKIRTSSGASLDDEVGGEKRSRFFIYDGTYWNEFYCD